jgi:hypothetical protein
MRREKKLSVGELIAKTYTQRMKNRLTAAGYDGTLVRYEQFILSSILYRTVASPKHNLNTAADLFWQHGISTDLPMIALVCAEDSLGDHVKRILCGFLRTHKYLSAMGISFDLLIFYREQEQYACPLRQSLIFLITETVGDGMLSRKGGIHLITDHKTREAAQYLCPVYLYIDDNTVIEKAITEHFSLHDRQRSFDVLQKPQSKTELPTDPSLSLSGGCFMENGYRVYKEHCKRPQSRTHDRGAEYGSARYWQANSNRRQGSHPKGNTGEHPRRPQTAPHGIQNCYTDERLSASAQ